MATISPVRSSPARNIEQILWETLTESDTAGSVLPASVLSLFGSVQVIGTFGGATVVFQGSNDGTNWVNLNDKDGNAISLSAAGAAEFSTAMLYLRPSASGGSSQDIDVYVIMRNQ